MDKESITQYAWIIIAVLVFAALVVFATPIGEDLSLSFISLMKGQQAEVNNVYSEESMKEQTEYMEQLFDATDTLQAGLYKHNDSTLYEYTWAELKYHDIIVVSDNKIARTNNKDKLSGDLILDDNITEIETGGISQCNNLILVRLGLRVNKISTHAFADCQNLQTFIASEGLRIIDTYAFADCENLKNVYLNRDIHAIEEGAFDGCDNLKVVYYYGTMNEWNNVTKDTAFTHSGVEKIICTDGEINL